MPIVPSGTRAALHPGASTAEPSTPAVPAVAGESREDFSEPVAGQTGASEQAESGARVPVASALAQPTLHTLLTVVEQAAIGVTGARAAGEHLAQELETLRTLLSEKLVSSEQRTLNLSRENERLRRELEQVDNEGRRQRQFWMDEQDRFLAGILDDHERLVARLQQERDEAVTRFTGVHTDPSEERTVNERAPHAAALDMLNKQLEDAMRTIAKLRSECDRGRDVVRRVQAQRDEAQEQVNVLAGERDRAYRELLALHAERAAARHTIPDTRGPSSPPEAPTIIDGKTARRTDPMPNFGAAFGPGALLPKADSLELSFPLSDVTPETPPSEDRASSSSAATEETAEKPGSSFDLLDPEIETHYPSSRPSPLKQKPDPTAMPLGSYSLSSDELKQDKDPPPRDSSKPRR